MTSSSSIPSSISSRARSAVSASISWSFIRRRVSSSSGRSSVIALFYYNKLAVHNLYYSLGDEVISDGSRCCIIGVMTEDEIKQQLEEIVESIKALSERQNSQYTDVMLLLKKLEEKLESI